MIPILYRSDELRFRSNGIGRLTEAVSCSVTEERNGIFELELVYPITGKWYQTMIDQGGIIWAIHDDKKKPQPFDIYKSSKPINGRVTFFARHISYRLRNSILLPFTALGPAAAFAYIQEHQRGAGLFSFSTDLVSVLPYTSTKPSSVRALLCGQEGSILDVYGRGEYLFDRYDVKLLQARGTDSGVEIRYGKNLLDIEDDTDRGDVYGAIAPYWSDGETTVYLPEGYVIAPELPLRTFPWTTENGAGITDGNGNAIDFAVAAVDPVPMDFTSDFPDPPTAKQLRERALAYLVANKPWLPDENITIDFLHLGQVSGIDGELQRLQQLCLCDTVSVYYPALGVEIADEKVIRTVYDCLGEKYTEIELGRLRTTLAEIAQQQTVDALEDVISEIQGKPSVEDVERRIDHATELITGGLGGYVCWTLNAEGKPQEILFLDAPDIETAVNVIRINKNGIGFSQNGYNGPFSSAWTIDGKMNMQEIDVINFVADIITGGTINADRVNVTNINGQNIKNKTITGGDSGKIADSTITSGNTVTQVVRGINGGISFSSASTAGTSDYPNYFAAGAIVGYLASRFRSSLQVDGDLIVYGRIYCPDTTIHQITG